MSDKYHKFVGQLMNDISTFVSISKTFLIDAQRHWFYSSIQVYLFYAVVNGCEKLMEMTVYWNEYKDIWHILFPQNWLSNKLGS